MTLALVRDEALRLSPSERAELAEFLWESIEREYLSQRQRLWAAEAESRIDAFEHGDLPTVDGPAALKALRESLRK